MTQEQAQLLLLGFIILNALFATGYAIYFTKKMKAVKTTAPGIKETKPSEPSVN